MRASSGIDPAASLGALVAERPARASLIEALHLDYCCGGGQTLAQACAMRSLEIDAVRSAIEALDQTGSQDAWLEDRDWRRATLAELCAHIVAVHHDGLREALPRIEALLCTVVRVHGSGHPELRDLQRAFSALRAQLEPHLASEEDELFPACLALERHGSSIEEALLEEHEHEHASVGEGLAALRLLAGTTSASTRCAPRTARCSTLSSHWSSTSTSTSMRRTTCCSRACASSPRGWRRPRPRPPATERM